MLPILLMLAAPGPETAIEAERAFNRSAQIDGQWTAFRNFSTPDALLFTPQPVKAHDVLPTRNPPIAVQWWPAESYVSCDGTVAVNTGPWVRPNASGYFTTVWVRQADGHYKWVYDGGDTLAIPRALPEQPKVATASCRGAAPGVGNEADDPGQVSGAGASADRTLVWGWTVWPNGARLFAVRLWNGRGYDIVLRNDIAAPPAQ